MDAESQRKDVCLWIWPLPVGLHGCGGQGVEDLIASDKEDTLSKSENKGKSEG